MFSLAVAVHFVHSRHPKLAIVVPNGHHGFLLSAIVATVYHRFQRVRIQTTAHVLGECYTQRRVIRKANDSQLVVVDNAHETLIDE